MGGRNEINIMTPYFLEVEHHIRQVYGQVHNATAP